LKYLLDTDICSHIIKQRPQKILKKFAEIPMDDIVVSSITVAELRFGIEKLTRCHPNIKITHQDIDTFLSHLQILCWDENAAYHYGKIRDSLTATGSLIGGMDMLIAAHAVSINAILVTNNTREFKRIRKLTVENWIR